MKKRFSRLVSAVAMLLSIALCFGAFGTVTAVTGDFDHSNSLTAQDAVYLMYHTLYGDEDYPLYYDGDVNRDGAVDSDDAVYLLYSSIFGESEYPLPELQKYLSNITLHNAGVNSYDMTIGSELPTPDDIIGASLNRYEFLGWYDNTLSNKYTTVPEDDMQLYAKYRNYWFYSFDGGAVYDPNNKKLIEAVNDPFGGSGKVLHTKVINTNDSVNYGSYRGLAPSVQDGISNAGFDFKKGHTYEISFSYRYAAGTASSASTKVEFYAVDPQGIYVSGSKTNLTGATGTSSSLRLTNANGWSTCNFKVTNTTDYKHLYIRLQGESSKLYDLYIDNLIIYDVTEGTQSEVQLFNNGDKEYADLKVGDTLPTLEPYYDDILEKNCAFLGWYDESLTTKYTKVVSGVNNYYAKYEYITKFTYEYGGMFDPNNLYKPTDKYNTTSWYRELDPTNENNIVLRVNLSNNSANTHSAFSNVEGSSLGYKMTEGKKYVISFDYYLDSRTVESLNVTVRGAAEANIGTTGGKTDELGKCTLDVTNSWNKSFCRLIAEGVTDKPYLILLAQGDANVSDVKIYFDNIVIREVSSDYELVVKTPVENLKFNDNGSVTTMEKSYIGATLPALKTYYGATALGWYNNLLNVQHLTVPESEYEFFAKYDGSVYNFENGGIFDPNNQLNSYFMGYSYSSDPVNGGNTVIKADLSDGNNKHFGLNASGYSLDGYKLKLGYTYTVSFKYYAENLNNSNVNVEFRGSNKDNIGTSGGKSNGYGGVVLTKEKQWTGVTVTFTYNGDGLTADEHYLLMLAQDGAGSNGTATVYFDDIVVKETEPSKSYSRKNVTIGDWTLGYYKWSFTNSYKQSIVVPAANFSYLARMQCDEMLNVVKQIGQSASSSTTIVKDSSWSSSSYKFSIFVGKVSVNPSDSQYKIDTTNFTEDDYAYRIGNNSIYVDGGSTYALAMAISELTKYLESLPDGSSVAAGTYFSGKYSEKIKDYSTKDYYRPTFLEDFDQEDIDTSIWNVVDGDEINSVTEGKKSKRSADHTYIENGNLVMEAAFDDKYYYGGMLRSHGNMEYRYGYLEVSCITPNGGGLWTSVWATQHGRSTGLFGSEVDINESFGNARYSAFNMHSLPTNAGKGFWYEHYMLDDVLDDWEDKRADAGRNKTFSDGYHTFGYLWTPEGAKFTVDGQVYFEYNYNSSSAEYYNDFDAFNEKLSLIVSMTVGNPELSTDDDDIPLLDETAAYWQTTNKYIVDYIHIYQIDGQEIYFYGE